MIEGRTIVCFASGYEVPPTSKHHVMHLLAERNRVLWVNYHASRTPSASSSDLAYMARKLMQVAGGLRRMRENLYVLTPLVVPLPGVEGVKAFNRALVISQVRLALETIRRGPVQVWSFTPDIAYLLGRFGEERVLYYCVDDFAHFSGYDAAQVLRDEAELAGKSDVVVTTSKVLYEAKKHLNDNTMLVPHGVDWRHFARAMHDDLPEPADVRGVPHPRIGFFGLIRDWVDVGLVAEVARRRGDWHAVFIGDADASVDLSGYRRQPNMHFLGRKPYESLPAYCRAFDAGVIPFRVNELTKAVNPIKLREYLAAGLPVVATPMPELEQYRHLIAIAEGPDRWERALEAALSAPPERRRALSEAMAEETWPSKLEAICGRLMGSRDDGEAGA